MQAPSLLFPATLGSDAEIQEQNEGVTSAVRKRSLKVLQEFLSYYTGSSVDWQLHFTDLLVDLLHKMNHKVDQLVFVHLLGVEVCDQEADVVSLVTR